MQGLAQDRATYGGVRHLVSNGSRCLVGNGEPVRIWKDRWLSRPYSYSPICAGNGANQEATIDELIDKNMGVWREETIRSIFIPGDADLVLSMPLCSTWP